MNNKISVAALKELQTTHTKPRYGICYHLEDALGAAPYDTCGVFGEWRSYVLFPLFRKWEHFSGDLVYPVPPSIGTTSINVTHYGCRQAYQDGKAAGTLYDPKTPYGEARLRLLAFLIEELSKDINHD